MRISEQSISELETVLSQFEKENGVIDLDELVTTGCLCKGSHCSSGCSGNKAGVW